MQLKEEKELLRKRVIQRLKAQSLDERVKKSALISEKIITSREFVGASVVMTYAAMVYEVDTKMVILHALKLGKRVILPLMDKAKKELIPCEVRDFDRDTHMCSLGFCEPVASACPEVPTSNIDVVYVPGLAFDSKNHRLGRGGGYYDRFLASLSHHVSCVGLGFDVQLCPDVPVDSHDVPLTRVITN